MSFVVLEAICKRMFALVRRIDSVAKPPVTDLNPNLALFLPASRFLVLSLTVSVPQFDHAKCG